MSRVEVFGNLALLHNRTNGQSAGVTRIAYGTTLPLSGVGFFFIVILRSLYDYHVLWVQNRLLKRKKKIIVTVKIIIKHFIILIAGILNHNKKEKYWVMVMEYGKKVNLIMQTVLRAHPEVHRHFYISGAEENRNVRILVTWRSWARSRSDIIELATRPYNSLVDWPSRWGKRCHMDWWRCTNWITRGVEEPHS